MKRNGIVLSIGALVSALFLSGCMAAMMPGMLVGHAALAKMGGSHDHDSANGTPAKPCMCQPPAAAMPPGHAVEGGSHERIATPCECENPAAVKTDAQAAPASPADENSTVPPSSGHKH
jgi:hypothetical protein